MVKKETEYKNIHARLLCLYPVTNLLHLRCPMNVTWLFMTEKTAKIKLNKQY